MRSRRLPKPGEKLIVQSEIEKSQYCIVDLVGVEFHDLLCV